MYRDRTIKAFRETVQHNIEVMELVMVEGEKYYPQLVALLRAYDSALYRKLRAVLFYALTYGEDPEGKQVFSNHPFRGIEFMASLDALVNACKGNKAAWRTSLLKLETLHMLNKYIPALGDTEGYNNTPEQQTSVKREQGAHKHPVTWYSVPLYDEYVLAEAENIAPMIKKMGNGINKDALRDALGVAEANRITDTGYGIHPETLECRRALANALTELLDGQGYATAQGVLELAGMSCPGHDKYRWEETWKAYKPVLLDGLKVGRPTKKERALYCLQNEGHIIRRNVF